MDEAALYAALKERRIRGASIDVGYTYQKADGVRVAPSRLRNVVLRR